MIISHGIHTAHSSMVPVPSSTTPDPSEASGPSSASGVDAAPPSMPDCASLSPDALMAYCQSRLNSLDSQMSTIFASQQQNATTTTAVNKIASALGDLNPSSASGSSATVNVSRNDAAAIDTAYSEAIADAGGKHTALGASLEKDQNTFDKQCYGSLPAGASKPGVVTVPSSTIATLTQSLKNDASDLNSNSELTMINLQSLMSQRETAVQLTTNLVQSLGSQSTDITKNIGS